MKAETAKEFLLKQYKQTYGTHYEQSSLKHLYEKVIIKAIIEYAELKCSEQRDICQHIFDCTDAQIGDVYKNAPKPDFK